MSLFNNILPVFLLIFFGWLLAARKIVTTDISKQLTQYVFWLASPAIIFDAISHYHISEILALKFTIAHLSMLIIVMLITFGFTKFIFHMNIVEGMIIGMISSVKNTIMIGLPLLISITDSKATIPVTITVLVFNIILTPILMFIFELNQARKNTHQKNKILIKVGFGLIKNPLIVAAILGVISAIWEIKLPTALNSLITYIAPSFLPCALFAVGVDLYSFNIKEHNINLIIITFINLILAPLVAICVANLLNLSTFYATSLVILSSLPTAKSMYVYAKKYHVLEKETAAVISLTTILSIITIPFFVFISSWLWP